MLHIVTMVRIICHGKSMCKEGTYIAEEQARQGVSLKKNAFRIEILI